MPPSEHNADIVIAGACVRSLAESAVRAGWRPICIDLFCDADLQQLIWEAGLPSDNVRMIHAFDQLESVTARIDSRFPLVPVGGLEFLYSELDRIRIIRPVFAMPSDVIAELSNPQTIFPFLAASGHLVPGFCSDSDQRQANGLPKQHPETQTQTGNWLKKDSLSSGGRCVSRIGVDRFHEESVLLGPSEYLQQETAGVPCSATFLANCHQPPVLLGCTMQICGEKGLNATGFQFCGNAGPLKLPDSVTEQLLDIASCLANRWPLRGVFGVDFMLNDGDVFVIEINPRLTASHEIHEGETPGRLPHLLQHCFAFQPPAPQVSSQPSASANVNGLRCRFILYSDRSFILTTRHHEHMMRMRRPLNENNGLFWISDIPHPESAIAAGAPFCSINMTIDKSDDLLLNWRRIQPHLASSLGILDCEAIADMMSGLQTRLGAFPL